MAIEAARQLNVEKSISGFRFKDVSIMKALTVSENETVETQFSMEKQPDQNDPMSVWYNFKLFLYKDSTFTQLSYGIIGVNLQVHSNEAICSSGLFVQANPQNALQSIVARNCWKKISTKAFYDLCNDHGVHYGDSFLGLDDIVVGTQRCAKATVDLDRWKRSIDGSKYQPHVIHPAALDAVLQLSLAALNQLRPGFAVAIPTKFEDLWISSTVLDKNNTIEQIRKSKLEAFSQASYTGFRNTVMDMVVTDPATSVPVLKCRVFCTTVDDRRSSPVLSKHADALCYSLEWRPDLDIASVTHIQKYCSIEAIPKVVETAEAINQTLALGFLSAQRTLREVKGLILNEQNLRYIKFLENCFHNINNQLKPEQGIELLRKDYSEESFLHLCDNVETLSPEGRVVARVARNMKHLLLGKVDVVELFFSDDMMPDYYQYLINIDTGFFKFCRWIDAYVHKYPSCKFLEAGAGTGSSTRHVLEVLCGSSI